MAARRPTRHYRPTPFIRMVCSGLQRLLTDRLQDTKDANTRKKLQLRIKLQGAYYLRNKIPDRATERRAGYGRADPAPWHPFEDFLKAGPSPLLYPQHARVESNRPRPKRKP